MCSDALHHIYEQLQTRYPLTLTSTLTLDDGFTEDMPILIGRNGRSAFQLYEYGGDFVFSINVPGREDHNHWHPQSIDEALQAVTSFMERR